MIVAMQKKEEERIFDLYRFQKLIFRNGAASLGAGSGGSSALAFGLGPALNRIAGRVAVTSRFEARFHHFSSIRGSV
jgi:hypothetical protein